MRKSDDAGEILVVDDGLEFSAAVTRLLTARGYHVSTAVDGAQALASIGENQPDVVLLDVMMPGLDGFEICRQIKRNPRTRLVPVVLVTGLTSREDRMRGIEVGADDFLAKPPDWQELMARVQSLVRLKRATDDLESAESVMVSLAMAIEIRDPYTKGHCQRLANYAAALGESLHLSEEDIEALHLGGFLHDLGKISIPDSVLLKPGPLSDDEMTVMKQHPIVGARLCEGLRSLRRVHPIVRHHHERLDGTGYPDGLMRDEIPLLAQVLSIVDIYDALTTPGPYRRAVRRDEACAILLSESSRGWRNEDLVQEFFAIGRPRRLDRPESNWTAGIRAGLQANGSHVIAGAAHRTPARAGAVEGAALLRVSA